MRQFELASFGEIPELGDHKPEETDECGWTVAMTLAVKNIEIPDQWKHDPLIRNNYGYTVALL